MKNKFLLIFLLISSCGVNNGVEMEFKLCKLEQSPFIPSTSNSALALRITKDICQGCEKLENCTTFEGSIQIQIVRQASPEVMSQLRFPKLTEITGYLLVSLVYGERSLKEIFPNLAVIRGKELFLDYSLVIYENDGLQEINLPSLTTILDGGVRIEKNINLCYVKTIRWESIMISNNSSALGTNNNDCYDRCFGENCKPPAGHGLSTKQYCWAPGKNAQNADCQSLCNKVKCGDRGCLKGDTNVERCCNEECLGGCFELNSPHHCYACRHLRQMSNGECVKKCQGRLYEIDGFKCVESCPPNYLKLEIPRESKKCVKVCPAGYQKDTSTSSQGFFFSSSKSSECIKCETVKCPRVCKTGETIEGLGSLAKYKGCTEIDGNLLITIRGSSVSGIGRKLEENLGKIEKVKGYIVIRECSSVTSLNFLKSLKEIEPQERIFTKEPILYNDRYALAILDNPKLEAMWPFQQNLSISAGGIMVHLNPYLCPGKIIPLVNDILRWNRSDTQRSIDISDTTNGNAAACDVQQINVTLEEVDRAPGRRRCNPVCIKVEWDEVPIADYRNVLFYTVSYREAPNRQITEYDGQDACSQENVWTRQDHVVEDTPGGRLNVSTELGGLPSRNRKLVTYIQKLKHFTLYAFQVEAVVLKNEGAKSNLVFIQTKENVPSQPVGPEANYINSSALLVKWQPPLYPNGIITKYIVKYNLSEYSPWKQDLNWCNRQILTGAESNVDDEEDGLENPDGTCKRNITCDCDKKTEEKERPERQAAIFAKEFQDKLYRTIFTKENDDKDPPTNKSIVVSTTPSTTNSPTNCSNDAQNPLCQVTTVPQGGKTTGSSNVPTTTAKPTSPQLALPTAKPSYNVTLVVNGTKNSVVLRKLKHFSDYKIEICACTKVGCGSDQSCAVIKGMTDKKDTADDLEGNLQVVITNITTREFKVTWKPPKDPNGLVLKYDIEIKRDSFPPEMQCRDGGKRYYSRKMPPGAAGNFSVRVRAITPAGNGSWSPVALFSLQEREKATKSPRDETEALAVGTVVGASLASCAVFVLACGFLIWYFARKRYERYTDETIPGVLYASVNPEYMTSTDVYIPDEWEFPREKIKLVRELGNGSFGMVYEGEAEDITPNAPRCRVAVKTVNENASSRDRVEFLQEASVMKQFSSNHVVRLLGVVSEGQPTLVIMELMELGDLKNFLRSRRPGEGSLPAPTLQELLQMAGEIADGMAYLAARKYVHRDLAARNCMVNANYTVKIGDFGMTRDIYETDYYRKGGKGLLPVRWMAPESLKDGVFTSNSDVWSFGVVMWEMATLACQPYPGKSNEEVLKFVVDGGLLEKPEECPDRLYDMMTLCWQHNAKARPTFVYLISLLEDDLADTFRELSFYHTLPEDQLKGLLSSHYKHKHKTETEESTLNVECAA